MLTLKANRLELSHTSNVAATSKDVDMRPMDDPRRKHYHDRALECLLAAVDVRDPEQRLKILEIAQQYILLAAFAGLRVDRSSPQRSPENET
jgi:hypothetical protein